MLFVLTYPKSRSKKVRSSSNKKATRDYSSKIPAIKQVVEKRGVELAAKITVK